MQHLIQNPIWLGNELNPICVMLPVVGKDISFFRQFLVKINDMS
jgi:hypothetical protein